MHKQSLAILHLPLSVCPSKMFTIIGTITHFQRELKQTVLHVQVVDYTKPEDNVEVFELILMGDVKTLGDKTLSIGDLIYSVGELKSFTIDKCALHVKWFLAWNSMSNSFESTKAVKAPEDLDATLAY